MDFKALVDIPHSRKSPFEGLEVTRNKSKTKTLAASQKGSFKLVFCSKDSRILKYLTTQDIKGKGAGAQNKLNNKYKQACLQQRA